MREICLRLDTVVLCALPIISPALPPVFCFCSPGSVILPTELALFSSLLFYEPISHEASAGFVMLASPHVGWIDAVVRRPGEPRKHARAFKILRNVLLFAIAYDKEITVPSTMLIIDDSRLTRMMVRTIVSTTYPEWQILEAKDAAEALQKAPPVLDVVTIDLNMPGMDGLTLSAELRKRYPTTRMALLTANIQESVRQKAAAVGIHFIGKPVTEEAILAFVEPKETVHD